MNGIQDSSDQIVAAEEEDKYIIIEKRVKKKKSFTKCPDQKPLTDGGGKGLKEIFISVIKENPVTVVRIPILIPKCTNFEAMSAKAVGNFFFLNRKK